MLVSILIHGAFLCVRFAPPQAFRMGSADSSLEIVLVNAKSEKESPDPQAHAQANLDGGGAEADADAIPASPLPDMGQISEGDILASAKSRVEELQKEQKILVEKVDRKIRESVAPPDDRPTERAPADTGVSDQAGSPQVLKGMAASIERNIQEQGSRPEKIFVTPRTREVSHAMYYRAMQRKIEEVGTLNFPQRNGRKLYGDLTVLIPVAIDGTLYEGEGGPRVERSSGNAILDRAAIRIVRRAAPFGAFPPKMQQEFSGKVWVMVARFRFTRDDSLRTD